MTANQYPYIDFHQYEMSSPDDRLVVFAAPAKAIWAWAGVPRKGWHVRMLYQRWITDSRKQELTTFWDEAGAATTRRGKSVLVGPTALTLAMHDEPVIDNGRIVLDYSPPFQPADSFGVKLAAVATSVLDRMSGRLDVDESATLTSVSSFQDLERLDFGHNYVLESLAQIKMMSIDADEFVDHMGVEETELRELIESLEALVRPALVVDGQHRLYGAAHSQHDVWLPVVAIPKSPWTEQIYQFVVINEKAQRVETSLLSDIFGSSLTPSEQIDIRVQLERAGASVDTRIAAVIAARDPDSPFAGLVKLNIGGNQSPGFIPEATMRSLMDGGRGALGWRSDDEFYDAYIAPTFQDRADWDSWTGGQWRPYWFAFWDEVRDFYNLKSGSGALWSSDGQTNLTKAVTLRMLQKLFMRKCIDRVAQARGSFETLVEVLGEDKATEKMAEVLAEKAIPSDIADFRIFVRSWFLERGVPARVFEKVWLTSLDDASGMEALYAELEDAFECIQTGRIYRAQNIRVFSVQ